jgi:hypothetical protein
VPDWAIVFLLAVILLVIGVWVLRFLTRGRVTTEGPSHNAIIERLERIERRLDEREPDGP